MADIGLFSFYGGFPRLELLNDVNIGIIRFYGRIERCMTFAECRPQTADCKCHTPRIELRDLLGYCWQSTVFHVPGGIRPIMTHTGKLPPESDTFFSLRISFIWNGEWRNEFPEDHCRLKADTHEGFCSRSMLQGHAPGANFLRVYQRFHGYNSSPGAEPMTSSGWPASSVG